MQPMLTPWRTAALVALLALAGAWAPAVEAAEAAPGVKADGKTSLNAGLRLRTEASAAEMGLPLYPGATRQRDSSDDEGAVSLGLWGGAFGFKLAVLQLASPDPLEKVAAYYREALGRYGPVLDCSPGVKRREPPPGDPQALRCDGDNGPDRAQQVPGALAYKVGSKRQFRLVSLQPVAGGVHFQLVHMAFKGD